MRNLLTSLLLFLGVFIVYAQCQATDSNNAFSKSVEIYHWALNSAQPSILAKIAYNPETLQTKVLSYTPQVPTKDDDEETIYRVGFYTSGPDGSKQWVGSLASKAALTHTNNKNDNVLQLYLSASQPHEVYHVSFSKSTIGEEKLSESIGVELVYPDAGTRPELNKPVVLSPDGTNPEEVPEKTLLQKYWWVLLAVSFLAMSGGGGEGGR